VIEYFGTVTFANNHPDFFTATCLEWYYLLEDRSIKNIIVNSLRFLVKQNRVNVYAFCIMNNHLHVIWQTLGEHKRENVQRDFMKYTGQQILRRLREIDSPYVSALHVGAKDRKYQVWERNGLSFSLVSYGVIDQKFNYIHMNPVNAGLCRYPWDYEYSSAGFYYQGGNDFGFLTPI
jgi:putative transposase